MKTLQEQEDWERTMVSAGIDRFRAMNQNAIDGGRYTETSAGNRLLKGYISELSQVIAEVMSAPRNGPKSMFMKLLVGIDADKLALFTLTTVIGCAFKPMTMQSAAAAIGAMVEDELRFSSFELQLPEYYNAVIRDLQNRNSTQYRHRHRVLVHTMNKNNLEWHVWSDEAKIGVGMILLQIAVNSSEIVEKATSHKGTVVGPTQDFKDWMLKHNESLETMLPDRMPCLIPPRDWTNIHDGGFHTGRLRGLTPLVKTRSGMQRDIQLDLLASADMPLVLKSVNAIQRTSWAINTDVLAVLQQVWARGLGIGMPSSVPYAIPPAPIKAGVKPADLSEGDKLLFDDWKSEARTLYALEEERKAALFGVVRSLRLAEGLKAHDLLYMVYQMDFRSRTYCTASGVSPQGADVSKALLHFGMAKALGDRGWFWFQVHGANKYGVDKISNDDRIEWVKDNHRRIMDAATDPIGFADAWKDADKPYQFLAWCFEYAAAVRGRPTEFMSRIPIALDGSCNGIQHFSAILRDSVGGAAVNLTPASVPADIYQQVADVATEKLKAIMRQPDHPMYAVAANWMGLFDKLDPGHGMSRKLSKKPVMTLPYGSTLQTCTQSVHGWYLEQRLDFFPAKTAFKHSVFLSKLLWDAIGEVVVAARAAMSYIQKCAKILAKENMPLVYTTPVGFPMVQAAQAVEKMRIETAIGGRLRLQVLNPLNHYDPFKAASGSSPNLIHSIDAAHMHMTVSAGVDAGIDHYAMIHDDFGVHACHVQDWHRIIREQFVKLHTEHDILEEIQRETLERTSITLPPAPQRGNLYIRDVLRSDYFFG